MTMETRENILNNGFDKAYHSNTNYISTMWLFCIIMTLITTVTICVNITISSDIGAYKRKIKELDSIRLEQQAQITMFNDSLSNVK